MLKSTNHEGEHDSHGTETGLPNQALYATHPAARALLRLLAAGRNATKPAQVARLAAAATVDSLGASAAYVWMRTNPQRGFGFTALQRGETPSTGRSGVGLSPENAPWLRRLLNQRGAMLLEPDAAVPMVNEAAGVELTAAPIWNRDWVAGVVVAVYAGLGAPNRYDLRALTTVAVRAGVALEGNDLGAALSANEQSLASVIRTTIEAQEEERRRVAGESTTA